MARFRIRFLKDVCNDVGRTCCILQRAIDVEASDAESASFAACDIFCARESIGHWRDHADRMETLELDLTGVARPTPER